MMKRHAEPFWWSLFGAGGAIAALFLPVLVFFFALAIPLGWVAAPSYEHLRILVDSWIARILLLAVISLSMFHFAHRFRFTLFDGLQLKRYDTAIALLCYGTAIGVTIYAGYFFLNY